ncbi:MAG: hypothetical protein GY936_08880 [Ignavibacteriae bacterium]|nr:hypothetical protein [Ignavibacteriota bacterium]
MKKQEKIEQEINKTLSQFEKAEVLQPNPYLFTRIQQRLDEKNRRKNYFSRALKPAFFSALLATNMITAIWYLNVEDLSKSSNTDLELIEILSDDFNLENDQSDFLLGE